MQIKANFKNILLSIVIVTGLVIGGYFIYNTDTENRDKSNIESVNKIDDVEFDLNFFSEHQLFFYTNSNEKIITNYFGKDGYFIFEFPYPLWKFWEVLQNTSKSPN